MTDFAYQEGRWEPPAAGDEDATLLGFLERQRATFAWKTGGLDVAGLRATLGPSAMTLGGMLRLFGLLRRPGAGRRLVPEPGRRDAGELLRRLAILAPAGVPQLVAVAEERRSHDETQPLRWLAIDPKVVAGEPAFGVAPLLWRRVDTSCASMRSTSTTRRPSTPASATTPPG